MVGAVDAVMVSLLVEENKDVGFGLHMCHTLVLEFLVVEVVLVLAKVPYNCVSDLRGYRMTL